MRTHLVGGPHGGFVLLGGLGPERAALAEDVSPVFRQASDGEPCYVRRVVALVAGHLYKGIHLEKGDEVYEWEAGGAL